MCKMYMGTLLGGRGENERVINKTKLANSSTVLAANESPVSLTEAPTQTVSWFAQAYRMNMRLSFSQRNGSLSGLCHSWAQPITLLMLSIR